MIGARRGTGPADGWNAFWGGGATLRCNPPRDRYRIEREFGQGGMATVYLAQDVKHAVDPGRPPVRDVTKDLW